MADSRTGARRSVPRSRTHLARGAGKTLSKSGNENDSGRSTLLKRRAALFPELDNDSPRVMLRRIIRTQPQVSPLAPQLSKDEETEDARLELPSKRVSNTVEMQLPELVPEDRSVAVFHLTKKRKKLSVSEFERAADKRLPQNQTQPTWDSTALARSLRLSLGSLIQPDTIEKRGLFRRPKNRKAIDMEAFEGGVEQNMLKRKGQSYLVDSQTASGTQTTMLTSDAEIILSNTELFLQPQSDEQSQNKLAAIEPQLSDSETSAQRSKISDAAQEEARPVGLVSNMDTNEERIETHSEELIIGHEQVDNMIHVSPKIPANQQEAVNRRSSSLPSRSPSKSLGSPVTLKPRRSFTVSMREVVSRIIEDLDVSDTKEEMVNAANEVEQIFRVEHRANAGYSGHLEKRLNEKAELQTTVAQDARVETEMASSDEEGTAEGNVEHQDSPASDRETTEDDGAGRPFRHSHAFSSSEKSEVKPLKEAVEEADELKDQAIMLELDGPEEEPIEDGAEDPESEDVSMKTPMFVRAAPYKTLLSTPRPAKPVAPKSPLKPLQAKPIPKRSGASKRKPREPAVANSLIKNIFSHYVKMPVARDAFKVIEKCCERYFRQLSNDLEAYSNHAGRKTVKMADLEVLMRRQGLVTEKMPMHVLIERYLPMEYRKLLIPVAVSGNKVIPSK